MKKDKKSKMNKGAFTILSILQLSIKSGIKYQRLYENINGVYNTLDQDERTALANTLFDETQAIYKYLGFKQEIKRMRG